MIDIALCLPRKIRSAMNLIVFSERLFGDGKVGSWPGDGKFCHSPSHHR